MKILRMTAPAAVAARRTFRIGTAALGLAVAAMALATGASLLSSWLEQRAGDAALAVDHTRAASGVRRTAPDRVVLVYRTRNGQVLRALPEAGEFSAFVRTEVERVEGARAAAHARAGRVLAAGAAPVFASMRARSKDFADWYYGWATTFELAGEALASTLARVGRPGFTPLHQEVERDLAGYVERRYRETVLAPRLSAPALREAYREALRAGREDALGAFASLDEAMQGFARAHLASLGDARAEAGARAEFDWGAAAAGVGADAWRAGELESARAIGLGAGGALAGRAALSAAGAVAVRRLTGRAAAPFAARAVATVTAAGVGAAAGPVGTIAGAVAGLGADWLVNAVTTAPARRDLAAEVRALVTRDERTWTGVLADSVHAAIDARFDDLVQAVAARR